MQGPCSWCSWCVGCGHGSSPGTSHSLPTRAWLCLLKWSRPEDQCISSSIKPAKAVMGRGLTAYCHGSRTSSVGHGGTSHYGTSPAQTSGVSDHSFIQSVRYPKAHESNRLRVSATSVLTPCVYAKKMPKSTEPPAQNSPILSCLKKTFVCANTVGHARVVSQSIRTPAKCASFSPPCL